MPLFTSEYVFSDDYPTIEPSLKLDFANARALDPRITFTRASTATYVGANGLIKTAGVDEARFDHDPATGESLGLLIEEQRTNLLTWSEDFTNTAWILFGTASRTANAVIAPDGNTTADAVTLPVGSGIYQFISASANTTYTFSVWLRSPSISQNVNIVLNTNLGDATQLTVTATTTWQRFSITKTTIVGTTTLTSQLSSGVGNTFYVWGAQTEVGAFPTSYIPTSGSTVTRSADSASITGTNLTSFYNQSKGTLFTSFRPLPLSTGSRYVQSSTIGSTLEAFYIRSTPTGSDSAIIDGGVAQAYNLINYTRSEQENSKHAYAYELNNFGVSAQGQLGSGDTSCTMPTITRFDIGSLYQDSNTFLNGYISQLFYYPKRLTNAQLQTLTQ
jgi:hypothetical protein